MTLYVWCSLCLVYWLCYGTQWFGKAFVYDIVKDLLYATHLKFFSFIFTNNSKVCFFYCIQHFLYVALLHFDLFILFSYSVIILSKSSTLSPCLIILSSAWSFLYARLLIEYVSLLIVFINSTSFLLECLSLCLSLYWIPFCSSVNTHIMMSIFFVFVFTWTSLRHLFSLISLSCFFMPFYKLLEIFDEDFDYAFKFYGLDFK